jgi:hypothetical protein
MGYNKAIWAIAHRLCRLIWKVLHDGVHYVQPERVIFEGVAGVGG